MRAWLWTGGRFADAEGLPASDRGFRYGMSLFESFPVHNGAGVFLERHIERLIGGCGVVGFHAPREALKSCAALLKRAGDGFARIYVTAGDGTATGEFDQCRTLVTIEAREPIPPRVYHRGYDLGIAQDGHAPLFPGLKTGNYWANLRAFREGAAASRNETLLFTPAGHLISACMANVFVVSGGKVKTPDLSTGARPGVMREWVMRRVEASEALLSPAEAEAADEIFLTSSWLGIMPCASINGRPLARRETAGPLLDAWRKEAR